jgi:transposase
MKLDIATRYTMIKEKLDEHARRLFLGSEALAIGRGGITRVNEATGVSRQCIAEGIAELEGRRESPGKGKIRRAGGGRKKVEETDKSVIADLKKLLEPTERGDPMGPLTWTTKSEDKLSEELKAEGHEVSGETVRRLLHEAGYSLQSNRKRFEGSENNPDRDEQFNYIAEKTKEYLEGGEPVISVDTKKKELVGNYANKGREIREEGKPAEVNVYDFIGEEGKASPYGVYDIGGNEGYVNVGKSYDTGEFAVEGIRKWWNKLGKERYAKAKRLYINADGGGSNGSRVRLWKYELQKFANESGLEIAVSHFPPGTSKWNKIEHRLFSAISINWRGKPLVDFETIVNLIAGTTNKSGLKVYSERDSREYEKGRKISDKEMESINLTRCSFHGDWNYIIRPNI